MSPADLPRFAQLSLWTCSCFNIVTLDTTCALVFLFSFLLEITDIIFVKRLFAHLYMSYKFSLLAQALLFSSVCSNYVVFVGSI